MKKPKSSAIFDDKDYPISHIRQMMVAGTGADIEELKEKPLIAVANSHTEMNPGHMHLNTLANKVKEGIHAAGGIPYEFNVPAPCDGMTEGHEGMRYILPQRELIADTVETYIRSMLFDGVVMIASCDKIIPGMIMAAARLDLPTIFLTGGPSAWNIRFMSGSTDSVRFLDYQDKRLRRSTSVLASCGACEIMGTANTFQCLVETLGLTLPGTANIPAFHPDKQVAARHSGKRIVAMVEEGLNTRKILTARALENAIMMDLAIGGSTNAALHLPAIAHELEIDMPLSRFNDYNKQIPTLLSISPNGPHGVIDLYGAGGIPAVMKSLKAHLNLDALNVSGKTIGQIAEDAEIIDSQVIRSTEAPYIPEGGTVVLFGNLAPEGAVVKQSAVQPEMLVFSGTARIMESEAEALAALRDQSINEGDVIVIRNEGPKGGPGMPETLAVTMALTSARFKRVALVTDGRFSGATAGPCVGHVSPESFAGGPIAALKDGDIIDIDIPARKINVQLSPAELLQRLQNYQPKQRPVPPGFMKRYVKLVSSAARGAVLE
ncbi:dihydroxy-acid dehydratase [bacterium]|nr:dihydroxy-acid dehydratase [bacterium]